jgi:hypothetical protein
LFFRRLYLSFKVSSFKVYELMNIKICVNL